MVSAKDRTHSTSISMKLFNFISDFTKKPKAVFWFFIILNMIPNCFLIFTEPLSGLGRIILILAPLGVYLIVFSLLKKAGLIQLILIPLLIFHAFQMVLFYLFGESVIAVDMFLNLPTTNASEAGELLNSLWPAIILVCVLYIPTIVLASMSVHYKVIYPAAFRRHMIIGGAALLVLTSGGIVFEKSRDNSYEIKTDIYPANIFYNLGYAVHKWHRSELYPKTSKEFTFHATRDSLVSEKREIYILVIGEASRAKNWSLWGYERETNPRLKTTENLILYKDALTQSNTTHKSVPLILSAADAEHYEALYTQKSIITAFKEVGFKTVFFSNQIPNRSFTDYFASEADIYKTIRLPLEGGLITENNYDQALIPLIKQCIDSLSDNLFIVLHTYGSHFNYRERYPAEFAVYSPDNTSGIEYKYKQQLINAYDNSIRYTDGFLADIIQLLNENQAESALLYSPDHGEDLLDDCRKKFLHASPIPTIYQIHIPFFLWFSESYKTLKPEHYTQALAHADAPVSTNAIFHTLLDLADIRTAYFRPDLSLVNPGFKRRPRMYLNDHDKPVNYYLVGMKKQDKDYIQKMKLNHDIK